MPLTFTLDPAVDPALRDGLLDLWTDPTPVEPSDSCRR
jgi:hypothetical protein